MSASSDRLPFVRDERGATLIEFGLILTPLLVCIMGLLEMGYSAYIQALLQGGLQTAARDSAIGAKTAAAIRADVVSRLYPLVTSDQITTTVRSYYNYSRVSNPEKLTTDRNGNGKYDAGLSPAECFEDANDNNTYDQAGASGRGTGGNPDEIVAYTVSVDYPRVLPTSRLLGFSARAQLSGTTMMRNQPFAKNVEVRTVCK